jgi:hypothetical protein
MQVNLAEGTSLGISFFYVAHLLILEHAITGLIIRQKAESGEKTNARNLNHIIRSVVGSEKEES